MLRVIKNFKKFRFLLLELVKKDIKLKYRRSYLGILWTLPYICPFRKAFVQLFLIRYKGGLQVN